MGMSTAYEESGRTRQKARTRSELIAATRALIEGGTPSPTVEQAAERASVSRTTAYRYFPSQTALLIAAHPEITTTSLLPDDPGDDPAERLDQAVERFLAMVLETEAQQRTMLRLSLEVDQRELPLRQGRAIGWFMDALAPLEPRLGKAGTPPAGGGDPQRDGHRGAGLADRHRRALPTEGRQAAALDGAGAARARPRRGSSLEAG